MTATVRLVPLIGLAALVPILAYFLGRSEPIVTLSATCVLLIVGSLLGMFGSLDQLPSQLRGV